MFCVLLSVWSLAVLIIGDILSLERENIFV